MCSVSLCRRVNELSFPSLSPQFPFLPLCIPPTGTQSGLAVFIFQDSSSWTLTWVCSFLISCPIP